MNLQPGKSVQPDFSEGCSGNGAASRVWKGVTMKFSQKLSQRFVFFLFMFLFLLPVMMFAAGKHEVTSRLRLATTTSTDNSGLLNVLLPPFEKETGMKVDVIAVGTGKAITLGKNGDVDVIMVHARAREDAFVAAGYGVNRSNLMHNDFVIIGPADDPARIKGLSSAAEAFRRIAASSSDFVSRADDSGTNIKEKFIWKEAAITPSGKWYKESGQGMGAVITMANDMKAYTLSDRGTFLSMKSNIDLVVLVQGDKNLYNPYGVIAVNPKRHDGINYKGAMAFIKYLTSKEGQDIIRSYKKNGEQLFYPDVLK